MKFIDKILKAIYKPDEKAGLQTGTGNTQDENIKAEPSGYESNAKVLNLHPDGGKNIDLNTQTTEADIHDALQDNFNASTGDIYNIGNPERAQKRKFKDIDSALNTQYFGNLEKR